MGTFGLGGLHRKSTWLYPVASAAALPPAAIDGSVIVTLDTNLAYEYDATLPGWVGFSGGGGGGGSTNVFRWSAGTPWSTVYGSVITNGGFGIILVDPDIVPRLVTGAAVNANDLYFIGMPIGAGPVAVDFDDGVSLSGGALRSKNVLWRSLAETTSLVTAAAGALSFDFDGGGMVGWADAAAITPISVGSNPNAITLRNGATFTGAALTAPASLVLVGPGATTALVATSGSNFGTKSLTSAGATASTLSIDASSRASTTTAVAPATLTATLLDIASLVFYDDFLVNPQLGASEVQGAIDALKSMSSAQSRLHHQDFTPVLSQTIFTLSEDSIDTTSVYMVVDHAVYLPPVDISVTGAGNRTITYLGPIVLDPGDSVRVYYYVSTPVPQIVDFTPLLGQTVFTLPAQPTDLDAVFMVVNHAFYYPATDFTIGGFGNQTITWVNPVQLDPSDSVRIYF